MIGTQVALVAMPWTDALVVARLGEDELAGGGLGGYVDSVRGGRAQDGSVRMKRSNADVPFVRTRRASHEHRRASSP